MVEEEIVESTVVEEEGLVENSVAEEVTDIVAVVVVMEGRSAVAALEVFGTAGLDFLEFGQVGGSKARSEGQKELGFENTGSEAEHEVVDSAEAGVEEEH